MVVMGGIVGSGIFVTPAIVASWTSTREEMIGAWIAGGGAALLGAFIYAGLSRRRPFAGGQYVYLREAYHPAVGFMYGWALLRSEEHTSELQSRLHLVCRLLLEKKKKIRMHRTL